MRLTDLVHDPYEGFDDSAELTIAERESRIAVREALQQDFYDGDRREGRERP
ncbi:MAG: hypothetical protein M3P53_04910 [Actinomycetota bacterium]|nr:hypothetical protein [Actinomycetota bacterium]